MIDLNGTVGDDLIETPVRFLDVPPYGEIIDSHHVWGEAGNDSIIAHRGDDTLYGGDGNDIIFGGDGADALYGDHGSDTLQGAGGDDYMSGGTGHDNYWVDSAGDVVDESDDPVGYDTVFTENLAAYTLTANVEQLHGGVSGAFTGTGNDLDNNLAAGEYDDVLSGMAGNDTLAGAGGKDTLLGGNHADYLFGGAGDDSMVGGAGDDTYDATDSGDITYETLGGGHDLLRTTLEVKVLPEYIEDFLYYGPARTNARGNALDNVMDGGSLNDTLKGLGGADELVGNGGADSLDGGSGDDHLSGEKGNDTMIGGTGDDTFGVRDAGDKTREDADEGTDQVWVTIGPWTLAPNVENLEYFGTNAFIGSGNDLDNLIVGKSGEDTLEGRSGDDTIDAGGGKDQVSGGSGRDVLKGGGSADTLNGGTGNDRHTGGSGADKFIFNSALDAANNVDRITDFVSGTDKVRLDDDIFTALGPVTASTALSDAQFVKGTAAADDGDRIIYDAVTGALYYDPDGTGGQAQVQFATLSNKPTLLEASDFQVVS